jgi:hypothetical protein
LIDLEVLSVLAKELQTVVAGRALEDQGLL